MCEFPVVYAAHAVGRDPPVSRRFRLVSWRCEDDYDYWCGMVRLWVGRQQTIVNVEHDMEYSDDRVQGLLDCPHPLCSYAYRLRPPHAHFAHNVSRAGWHPPIDQISRYTALGIDWVDPGAEWADFGGIGFCKIRPSARVAIPPAAPWQWLEMSVHASIRGRWHLHWPAVKHYPQGDG